MAKNAPKNVTTTPAAATEWTRPKNEHYTSGQHPVIGRIVLSGMPEADGHYLVCKNGLLYLYAYQYKKQVVPTTVNDDF